MYQCRLCVRNKRRSAKKGSIWVLTIGVSSESKLRPSGGLVFPEQLKTRNEPRQSPGIFHENLHWRGLDVGPQTCLMVVKPQLPLLSARLFFSMKRIKNIPIGARITNVQKRT